MNKACSQSPALPLSYLRICSFQNDRILPKACVPCKCRYTRVSVGGQTYIFLQTEGAMATKNWKCDACGYIGNTEKFATGDNDSVCPECGEEDNVFPHRMFRCLGCKFEADQPEFFKVVTPKSDRDRSDGPAAASQVPSDPDPTEEKWKRNCQRVMNEHKRNEKVCGSTKWKQIA